MLPLVGSTSVEPGRSVPRRSASSIMARAIRSFTLPPGFWDSTLARIVALPARAIRPSRTSGVFADQIEDAVGDSRTPGHRLSGSWAQMW